MEEEQVPGKYLQGKGRDRTRRRNACGETAAGRGKNKMRTGELIKEQKGFVSH